MKIVLLILFLCPIGLLAGPVTIRPLSTGSFETSYANLVQGGRGGKVRIPIPFYLIDHPKGMILFDSGLGTRFEEEVKGWWVNRLLAPLLPHHLMPTAPAVRQLSRLGIAADRIQAIIVSHLHFDHAGGLRDFPEAEVVVSRREWDSIPTGRFAARIRGIMKEQLTGIHVREIDYSASSQFGPFEGSFDYLGDRSLILLSTPGHTPGHQSLLVTLGSGKKVLLTGDAVWVGEGYKRPAPKGWLVRTLEEESDISWRTTQAIHEFHRENPDCFIVPGHDPGLWPTLAQTLE